MPRIHDASKREEDSCERMDYQEYENRPSLGHKKVAVLTIDTVLKFWSNICFKTWVRIVNGVDKYVTESMLTKEEEEKASGTPMVEARPRQKPTVTLTSVSIPVLGRKWIV